jgi:hypothetical protein
VKIDRSIADMSGGGNGQFPIEAYELNLHGVWGFGRSHPTVSESLMTSTIKPTAEAQHAPHRRVTFNSMESLGFSNSTRVWSEAPTAPRHRGRHAQPGPDTLADRRPDEVGDWITGRNVRWGVIVSVLVMVTAASAVGFWLYQRPLAEAALVEAELTEHAHGVEAALPLLEQLNEGILSEPPTVSLSGLDREARALFEISGQLTDPRSDIREISAQAARSALDGIRLAGDAVAYRSAVAPLLVAPQLETDPQLIELDEAARQFGDWQLGFDQVLSALPAGVLPAVTEDLDALSADLTTVLASYMDALREDDAGSARAVLSDMADRLTAIDLHLTEALGETQTQVSERIAETTTALSSILDG